MEVNLISNTGLTIEIDGTHIEIDGTHIESKPVFIYLGVFVDFKHCINTDINVVLEKHGKQSRIVSKLRHCVPQSQLIHFYTTHIQPTNQYSVLINGCCSCTSLLPFVKLKKNSWANYVQEEVF